MTKSIGTRELADWLDGTLQATRFKDYCPNGLQVEGRERTGHIITGVTASEALLRAAIERNADAVLVHHGWFWKNEDPRVRGPRRTRLALTLAHGLNLFAYHLPLDAHPQLGNNAQLARVLGLEPERVDGAPRTCGPDGLVWLGAAPGVATLGDLARRIAERLGREPLVVGDAQHPLRRVAWCTGAAQGMLGDAIDAGVDAYITGEASEPTVHLARETGTGFIGAGHHATERYGIQALGEAVARQFGIRVDFIDIDNPV
ncbi:Nif3-like dinuclear metal center hexameric protein [Bordetella genomosp. 13]|uniref:Nif3-like dinuclear metal center hexameric protein n=1 Tax=Bordetella genomosp. 13 TaxID=463040 RepID=A0A1W6Z720_9BORD|nr:Nif3-like dinuclear metal center hexameric protein [Bordetella genomosp. 13]ARP93052.1 Nif3-like dinuclear metal center hexameric protein [Bordetella genomosp. 13]